MSLIDFDSWITESEACTRLSIDIQAEIASFSNQEAKLPNFSRAQFSAKIRKKLTQLNNEIISLNKTLDKLTKQKTITRDESERRQREVEKLQSKYNQLNIQFDSINRTSIASSIIKPSSSSLWDDDDDEPAIDLSNVPTQQLYEDQKTIIERQNDGLDNLAKTISRQKNIALRISDEVTEQNDVLDDIAVQMERTNDRIGGETHVITTITNNDSTWGYWLVIICLLIAIVVVIFV